jgi:rhodanese-related sulfurtransferase/protein-S-isoprenylcysteine O-methyltransferase Ste14
MLSLLRHALSVIALPGTVTVAIPIWIARRNGVAARWPDGVAESVAFVAGAAALAIGLTLFIGSLRRFVSEGKGTLAPWDPPRHLVVHGLYRYVRNPMISGVLFVLAGEALVLRSLPHAWWAFIFLMMNVTYIPLLEEPMLEIRFGDEYREYCAHVPRFLPRLTPWAGPGAESEEKIVPADLLAMIQRGEAPLVLDVRSRREFARGHVPGARNVSFWSKKLAAELGADRDRSVVVYCGHGPRAAFVARTLRRHGFSRVRLLDGHMSGWHRGRLPVE